MEEHQYWSLEKKQKKKLTKLALKHSDPFPFSSKNIAW